MIPAWAGQYVGLPFDREHMNCWTLVRRVYRDQLGVELPPYDDVRLEDARAVARAMSAPPSAFRRCPDLVDLGPLDVVLMSARVGPGRRAPLHVGVAVSRSHVLHADAPRDSVIVSVGHYTIARRLLAAFSYEGT